MAEEPVLKGDYIFSYLVLPDRKLARQTLRAVKRRYGLPAASIALGIADNYGLGVDKTVFDAGPREFLNLLVNAKAVVASSFHGVAFGLHFRKDVYLPPERIISASNPPPASGDMDYSRADARFAEELAKSQNYLKGAIGAELQK